jgi:regulator of protease activity HflC (stomatin/prohibitin superfamily)
MRKCTIGCIIAVSVTGVIVLLIAFSVLGTSFKTCEDGQYCLRIYGTTRKFENRVYDSGKHLWAPEDKKIEFPIGLQNIEHGGASALTCFTSDKVELSLTIGVQYDFVKQQLIPTFKRYGGPIAISGIVSRISRDTFRDVCGNFTYDQFYKERSNVEKQLVELFEMDMSEFTSSFELGPLQLTNIAMPDGLATELDAKELAEQNVAKADAERNTALIAATTEFNLAKQQQFQDIAKANTYSIVTKNAADTTVINGLSQWTMLAEAHYLIMTDNGLDFDGYIEYLAVSV